MRLRRLYLLLLLSATALSGASTRIDKVRRSGLAPFGSRILSFGWSNLAKQCFKL